MDEQTITKDSRVHKLYEKVSRYIHVARQEVMRSVNTEQVTAYWLIGTDIVEEE